MKKIDQKLARFEFNKKTLKRLKADGLISDPMTDVDFEFLDRLKKIWVNHWYLSQMSMQHSKETREAIMVLPGYSKIDRYVLNTYLNLGEGKTLTIKVILQRIESFFGVGIYDRNSVKRIRQVAYNLRRQSQNKTRARLLFELGLLDKTTPD